MVYEPGRYDFNEDETHWGNPDDDPNEEKCANCGVPSEGVTEVITMVGDEVTYFCGTPCEDQFLEEKS